jgi:iron complex outermembrane receptor protein
MTIMDTGIAATRKSRQLFIGIITFILVFTASFRGYSQQVADSSMLIEGRVVDNAGQPVPSVSVSLVSAADSSVIKLSMTDAAGIYRLEYLREGSYVISVHGFGYLFYFSSPFRTQGGGMVLREDVVLTADPRMLAEVSVTARKPLVEVKSDRTVLNVASSVNAVGTNAFELLRMAPGTRIRGDEVFVNGRSGLLVFMDGNQVNLQGGDLNNYLRTLPSGSIESIEIITNPSSKYDAGGGAGIVNIVSKKNLRMGFNGSLSLNGIFTYYRPKYNGILNLNYRNKKMNLYGNYDYFHADNTSTSTDLRKQVVNGSGATFDQRIRGNNSFGGHNFKAGADFFLSGSSTLGFIADGSISDSRSEVNSFTDIYRTAGQVDSQLVARNLQPRDNSRLNYNANYRYVDTASGRELSMNANYGAFAISSHSSQPNIYYSPTGRVLQERIYDSNTSSNFSVMSFNADYRQKLWGGNVSAGVKASDVGSDNSLLFHNVVGEGLELDTGRTNQFDYTEKIYAAYLDYKLNAGRWGFQAGTRGEWTSSRGVLSTLRESRIEAVDTTYVNLFPNALVNYTVNDNNRLGLNFNSRIERPAYQALNPFEFVYDELSYIKGNPFLRPQYTREIKLTHTYKGFLTSSLSYSNTRHKRLAYREALEDGRTSQTTINIGRQKIYNFSTSADLNPTNWWNAFLNFSVFREEMAGVASDDLMDLGQTAWSVSGTNTFTVLQHYKLEVSGFYNSKVLDAPAFVSGMGAIDLGAQRNLFGDQGSIRLSVSDVFNILKFRMDRDFGGLYYRNTDKWETRQFKLSFTYKFGRESVKNPESRKTGIEDEKNRVR